MSRDDKIVDYLRENGCDCRFVKVEHLNELREEIESRRRSGLIDEVFYQNELSGLRYKKPIGFSPRSIVVIAVPQPSMRVMFHWKGKAYPTIVPPTYADWLKVRRFAQSLLKESTKAEKWKFVKCLLPLKTLATHSGLAMYGRNNISYIPKYGSFHRLVAFFTNYPCETDQWQEPSMLPLCVTCQACIIACPTGAISGERFLLRAERCLTYFNEMPAEKPFPAWINPSWHRNIVGCMRCQEACPYDKGVISWAVDRCSFSEGETEYLLKGNYSGDTKGRVERKLKRAGLDISFFPRNLAVLLIKD